MNTKPGTGAQGPSCRICGKPEPILCYDPTNHATAICPECCGKGAEHANGETGHEWEHDRYERDDACVHCGIFKRCTDYNYSQDYEP